MNIQLYHPQYGVSTIPATIRLSTGSFTCAIEIRNEDLPIPLVDIDASGSPAFVTYLRDTDGSTITSFSGTGLMLPRVGDTLRELEIANASLEYIVTSVVFCVRTSTYIVSCSEAPDKDPAAHKKFSLILKLKELLKLV